MFFLACAHAFLVFAGSGLLLFWTSARGRIHRIWLPIAPELASVSGSFLIGGASGGRFDAYFNLELLLLAQGPLLFLSHSVGQDI